MVIAHNGKRKSVKVGDREAAEALASKLRASLKTGDLQIAPQKTGTTFGEYAQKWLDGHVETSLKFTTQKSYGYIIRVHLGSLMSRPLDQITRPELRELIYEKLKSGLAPKTGINPLTRDEARAFLEAVEEHNPRYFPFSLCALRTGMRLGELLALEWGDIDFLGGFIEVRRSFTHGHFTTPKNGKSRRVDMSPQLAETLKELRTERKREALAKGWGQVPELVFVNEIGGPISESNPRNRIFFKALEKAGLRRIRIHDLRHGFASLLLQQKESLTYVKEQMGHSSIQITVDTYGHLVPGANRQAVAKLDDDFSPLTAQKSGAPGVHKPG